MFEVTIIGGGPAGLSAALVIGRALRKTVVIDAGRPRNLAARELHGFLGHDPIAPQELLALGRREIARYGVVYLADEAIGAAPADATAQPLSTQFRVWTRGGEAIVARKLLIATGIADELPAIPGLRECYGLSVHHCPYCDGWEHRDEPLFALGDSLSGAIGLALSLRGWSQQVTVLTQGDVLEEAQRERLSALEIDWCEAKPERIVHRNGRLEAVELAGGGRLAGRALFFHAGQEQPSNLLRMLGCRLDSKQHAETTHRQRTEIPGLFLAGDVDGDVQLAIIAAAEGATAAAAILRELQEEDHRAAAERNVRRMVSMGLPRQTVAAPDASVG